MSGVSSITMEAKAGRNALEFSLQNIKNIPRFLHHDVSTHCLPLNRPNAAASQNAMLTPWLLYRQRQADFINLSNPKSAKQQGQENQDQIPSIRSH
jgi:hypothetical protein